MSRVRTRPTRADTRQQLFEAAAKVFQEQGIGAASIDAVAEAAGLTRGAFYSNFANKDELIVAMLEHHVDQSIRHYRDMLAAHPEPADFVTSLRTAERSPRDPLGRTPLLHLELILYVARLERRRPDLRERLRTRRALIAEIIEKFNRSGGLAIEPQWGSAMLLALEDGFRLHRLIDPQGVPADSFFRSVAELQRLLKR
jgi:AcrR family transcriptional regulator